MSDQSEAEVEQNGLICENPDCENNQNVLPARDPSGMVLNLCPACRSGFDAEVLV